MTFKGGKALLHAFDWLETFESTVPGELGAVKAIQAQLYYILDQVLDCSHLEDELDEHACDKDWLKFEAHDRFDRIFSSDSLNAHSKLV